MHPRKDKPAVYMNARGETVIAYYVFKQMDLDAIMSRLWGRS